MKAFIHRYGILILTLILLTIGVVALVKLTAVAGQNLEPIRPRLLIFGATWCQFCPTDGQVDKLRSDYPGVEIIHYDVDKDRTPTAKYHIARVPTFILCDPSGGCKMFHSIREVRKYLNALEQTSVLSEHVHKQVIRPLVTQWIVANVARTGYIVCCSAIAVLCTGAALALLFRHHV